MEFKIIPTKLPGFKIHMKNHMQSVGHVPDSSQSEVNHKREQYYLVFPSTSKNLTLHTKANGSVYKNWCKKSEYFL